MWDPLTFRNATETADSHQMKADGADKRPDRSLLLACVLLPWGFHVLWLFGFGTGVSEDVLGNVARGIPF